MNTEIREKEIFDEMQEKQAKLVKKLSLGMFDGIGFVFSIAGIVLIALNDPFEDATIMAIIFLSIGLFLIALGTILFFAVPTKYNYEKYKTRAKKYGAMNVFEMNAKIEDLEARIEELEKK